MAWDIQGGYAVPNKVLNYCQRTHIDTVCLVLIKRHKGKKTFTNIKL
jgi:hypothetical protein